MAVLEWDKLEDRMFTSGVDRGVIYANEQAHVWNGLTSVVEKINRSTTSVFFDGSKAFDQVTLGAFSATVSAITYPDIIDFLAGKVEYRPGFYLGDQYAKPFSLCYRTMLRNMLTDDAASGYKLHILYDATAYPADVTHNTVGANVAPVVFQWDVTTIPQMIAGHRPTGYFEINSNQVDPLMLKRLEEALYGTPTTAPYLPSVAEIASFYDSFYRILIIDNGDGTWTAQIVHEEDNDLIQEDPEDPGKFTIDLANVVAVDGDTYTITDTKIAI